MPTAPTRSPTGRCSTRWSTPRPARPGCPSTTAAASASAAPSTPARSASPTAPTWPRRSSNGCSPTTRHGCHPPRRRRLRHADEVAAERGVRIPMQENADDRCRHEFDAVLWRGILDVGRNRTGGYRRGRLDRADLTLREWFTGEAQRRGMTVEDDRNGNMWAWWMPTRWAPGRVVTGSHLDSVPDGGAYDGPLGVVAAFPAIDELARAGRRPAGPIAVVAFAEEEGARFGVACLGSRLITGALTRRPRTACATPTGSPWPRPCGAAGRRPDASARPDTLGRIGRVCRAARRAGPGAGRPGRAGRPCQRDLAARPVAVHLRRRGQPRGHHPDGRPARPDARRSPSRCWPPDQEAARHGARATVGQVRVDPNGTNAIPSRSTAWLDARAADEATLATWSTRTVEAAAQPRTTSHGRTASPSRSRRPRRPRCAARRLLRARWPLGDVPVLPTGAGHDAGVLSATCRPRCCSCATPPACPTPPRSTRTTPTAPPGGRRSPTSWPTWPVSVTGDPSGASNAWLGGDAADSAC